MEKRKIISILNLQVHREMFDLLVGLYQQREEWNFVTTICGELSVMMFGD